MGPNRKQVFFPLEIKPRELLSRIMLGGIMAQHGYRVHIGAKVPVNAAVLSKPDRGGVYFYKSTRSKATTERLKQKVDAFCVLDEEMGVAVANLEQGFSYRLRGLERVDKFFAISEHVADAARKVRPELADRIFATGWPKVDTWRPEFASAYQTKAESYRARYGDFVLFSSDFGILTEERLKLEIARAETMGIHKPARDAMAKNSRQSILEFEQLCAELRIYDETDGMPMLIVRPHPAEDHHIWHSRFDGAKRIRVIYEDDVSSWVRACRMMVHRGCTTGVEARIANVPSFLWHANGTAPRTNTLPYILSAKIFSLSEIAGHWANPQAAMLEQDIPAHLLEFGPELASERITREIDAIGIRPTPALRLDGVFRAKLGLRSLRRSIRGLASKAGTALGIASWDHLKSNKRQTGLTADEVSLYLARYFPGHDFKVTTLVPELVVFELTS